MTADSLDNFEYLNANEHLSQATRQHYWAVAIGLQDVDGLSVSPYLHELACDYTEGRKSLDETGQLIRTYHYNTDNASTKEADLVSQRIVELLTKGAFYLAPDMLACIHKYLFQDLDADIYHPGEFKTQRMIKQEEILNGDSVLYADPLMYETSLHGAFNAEATRCYTTFTAEELTDFCHTIAFLWQIHPFYEGNTRTVAVFSELYLNYMGFKVTNHPFEQNARYYRDALVRAIYRNAAANVTPDNKYLVAFYENVLGLNNTRLARKELICTALFEDPSLLRNVDPQEALHR